MRLARERTDLEWPDEVGSRQARAALLFDFADRYAELIEWAALRCDADGEPLTERQRAALLSAGAMLLRAEIVAGLLVRDGRVLLCHRSAGE
jgi:hypothetical protein